MLGSTNPKCFKCFGNLGLLKCLKDQFQCGLVFPSNPEADRSMHLSTPLPSLYVRAPPSTPQHTSPFLLWLQDKLPGFSDAHLCSFLSLWGLCEDTAQPCPLPQGCQVEVKELRVSLNQLNSPSPGCKDQQTQRAFAAQHLRLR